MNHCCLRFSLVTAGQKDWRTFAINIFILKEKQREGKLGFWYQLPTLVLAVLVIENVIFLKLLFRLLEARPR